MKTLDRAAILAAKDVTVEAVPVPEWGGQIHVRSFDGATRARLLKPVSDGGQMPTDWMEQIIVATACDAAGALLFTKEDIPAVGQKSALVLERIFETAITLNGLTNSSVEAQKGESKPTPK